MSLVKNLIRSYGNFKIDIPNWEIPDEGISALWGPSGAGKTSTFRLLIGLDECRNLEWNFKGIDLGKLPAPQRRLGVVFQSYELFPHMSARDNILFAAEARKISESESREEFGNLVRDLSLSECLFRRAHQLSGGEQQRVALARALIGQPRFLFLDEPFSALDQDLKTEARKLVVRVIEQRKIPSLLVTHDKDDLLICKKVFTISHGKLKGTD